LRRRFENNDLPVVIIDELSLETILEKIYLEAYSFEDLREYVYSALKKVVSLDDFLDILYSSIQNYSLVISLTKASNLLKS